MTSTFVNCVVLLLVLGLDPTRASITTSAVAYKDGVKELPLGYLAHDSTKATAAQPKPGIVIVPGWTGVSEYEQERARMLAELGYVAMVADIYGTNYTWPQDQMNVFAESKKYKGDVPLFVGRIQAAINELKKLPFVDANKIGAIGYCFGGTGVINLAISGADIAGIVSFHGGLTDRPIGMRATKIPAKMLILSGGDDDASSDVTDLEDELNKADGTTWEISRYSNVVHSFTHWGLPVTASGGYNARADFRSWESMKAFFHEIFDGTGLQGTARTQKAVAKDMDMSAGSSMSGSSSVAPNVAAIIAAFAVYTTLSNYL